MKVIVAGTRTFNDYSLLKERCDYYLSGRSEVEVVSGKARGADSLGERYAKERGFPVREFPADWDKLGKRAGYLRNEQMALYADALICFWDGQSRGTKSMIELAKKQKLKVRIVYYTPH